MCGEEADGDTRINSLTTEDLLHSCPHHRVFLTVSRCSDCLADKYHTAINLFIHIIAIHDSVAMKILKITVTEY